MASGARVLLGTRRSSGVVNKASSNQPRDFVIAVTDARQHPGLFNAESIWRKITNGAGGSLYPVAGNAFSTSERRGSGNAEERGEYRYPGCCVNFNCSQ